MTTGKGSNFFLKASYHENWSDQVAEWIEVSCVDPGIQSLPGGVEGMAQAQAAQLPKKQL